MIEPLKRLAPETEVRLVIDGLERLATGARNAVMDALNDLADLPFIRLIVTARPDTELPAAASTPHGLAPAPAEKVVQYLERRAVAPSRREEIIKAAEGNWLVVRVLADLVSEHPNAEVQEGKLALADAYEELLTRCGANENTWRVLLVMAAAGAGPVLPLTLLCAASEKLGGLATQASLRDELFRLRGLVARTAAGTDQEHVGLFHQTLVDHVADREPERALAAHRALADCIEALTSAGAGPVDLSDPILRYAFEREVEHLWALGETARALQVLSARTAPAPRDNLRRWRLWHPRVENRYGADHPDTLTTRGRIAFWTGGSGDARGALRLYETLLADQTRALGVNHPSTLTTRNNIAVWIGECGDTREALRLFKALLPDQTRVLGPITPTHLLRATTSPPGLATSAMRAGRCNCFRRYCLTRYRHSVPITQVLLLSETTSLRGQAAVVTHTRRYDCSRPYCPTRRARLAPMTLAPLLRATTLLSGLASAATRVRRCDCSRRCCLTGCASLALITRIR